MDIGTRDDGRGRDAANTSCAQTVAGWYGRMNGWSYERRDVDGVTALVSGLQKAPSTTGDQENRTVDLSINALNLSLSNSERMPMGILSERGQTADGRPFPSPFSFLLQHPKAKPASSPS